MDYDERTSEEERKAIAAYKRFKPAMKKGAPTPAPPPSGGGGGGGDFDIDALLSEYDNGADSIKPILELDAFSYWAQRLVAETVFRDALTPADPKVDSAAVLSEKQMYVRALSESKALVLPAMDKAMALIKNQQLRHLLQDSYVLVTTNTGLAHFYPNTVTYPAASGDELAVLEFLHVALHMDDYMRAVIVRSCLQTPDESYLNLSYAELWTWLATQEYAAMPVSHWPLTSTVPFVACTRRLYAVYKVAQEVALFSEASL